MFDPGPLRIEDLPPPLRAVPPLPTGEHDPAMEAKRARFFAWRDGVLAYRRSIWRLCGERVWGDTGKPLDQKEPAVEEGDATFFRQLERVRCARDPAYFAAVWCSVYEARGGFGRTKGWQPAIPYPFQVLFLRWRDAMLARAEADEAGVIAVCSKARTLGVSWFLCLWNLHGWLHREAFSVKMVSRKEELVDSASLDSLFARVTAQFDFKRGDVAGNPLALPAWLRPQGFDAGQHKTHLLLRNPANGNEINGESTSSTAGRGGRATVGDIDEGSFVRELKHVVSSMTETVLLPFVTSSESVEIGFDFQEIVTELKQARSDNLLELDWFLHPHYDQRWLEGRRLAYERQGNLAAFFREILRDAGAGLTAWAYPKARDLGWLAEHAGHFPYLTGSPTVICIDPGRDDECALHVLCRDLFKPGAWRVFLSYANRAQEPEFYASLVAGIEDDRFRYGPVERGFMEQMRTVLYPEIGYGDPYGGNAVTSKADAWYAKMATWWAEREPAAERRLIVPISCGWKQNQRSLQGRRTALMRMLDLLYFDEDPQVAETLRAVQNQTWDVTDGTRAAEQVGVKHDHRWTHRTSALEYWAVHLAPTEGATIGDDDFAAYSAAD